MVRYGGGEKEQGEGEGGGEGLYEESEMAKEQKKGESMQGCKGYL